MSTQTHLPFSFPFWYFPFFKRWFIGERKPNLYAPKYRVHFLNRNCIINLTQSLNGVRRKQESLELQACLVVQSCLTLCYPMDCSLPGSSVHRIFQVRMLEWVAITYSRGNFLIQGSNLLCLLHCRRILHLVSHLRSLLSTWPSL